MTLKEKCVVLSNQCNVGNRCIESVFAYRDAFKSNVLLISVRAINSYDQRCHLSCFFDVTLGQEGMCQDLLDQYFTQNCEAYTHQWNHQKLNNSNFNDSVTTNLSHFPSILQAY